MSLAKSEPAVPARPRGPRHPARNHAALVAAQGARVTWAAVVITAGFGELGQGQCIAAGPLEPRSRICCGSSARTASASWCPASGSTPVSPPRRTGRRYRFRQPVGAMITAMLDWAAPRALAFRMSSRSAIWPMSISATCSTSSPPTGHGHPALRRGDHPGPQIHVRGPGGVAGSNPYWC